MSDEKRTFKEWLIDNLKVFLEAYLIAFAIRLFILEGYKIPSGSMIPSLLIGDQVFVVKPLYGVRIPIVGWKLPALSSPHRGDIIVFHSPSYRRVSLFREIVALLTFSLIDPDNNSQNPRNLIKRVIGLPGETVSMKDGIVYINGKPLKQTAVGEQIENGIRYILYKENDWTVRYIDLKSIVVIGENAEEISREIEEIKNRRNFPPIKIPDNCLFVMGDNRDDSADSRYFGFVDMKYVIGKAFVRYWPISRWGLVK